MKVLAKGDPPPGVVMELIWNLPEEGAFAKALGGDQYGWNTDRILTMTIANELKILNYYTLQAAGQKNVKKPKLWEVPQSESEKPTEDSLAIEAKKLAEWMTEE